MSYRERQRRDDDEGKARRATAYGTIALGVMLALILVAGSTSLFNEPAALLGLSLLLCPPAGWLATRCLLTRGAEARVHAWIALILIVVIVGGQIITLLPYFAPSTWD